MIVDFIPDVVQSALEHQVSPAFARDNLGTLRVVEAAYRSMSEARSVRPEEIAA